MVAGDLHMLPARSVLRLNRVSGPMSALALIDAVIEDRTSFKQVGPQLESLPPSINWRLIVWWPRIAMGEFQDGLRYIYLDASAMSAGTRPACQFCCRTRARATPEWLW